MSWSGRQGEGARRNKKALKREEAEARNEAYQAKLKEQESQ